MKNHELESIILQHITITDGIATISEACVNDCLEKLGSSLEEVNAVYTAVNTVVTSASHAIGEKMKDFLIENPNIDKVIGKFAVGAERVTLTRSRTTISKDK